jgi:hypothetical protein
MMLNDGQTSQATALLTLVTMGLMLWFSVRVTRTALDVTPMVAVGFVAVETLITYPLAVSLYEVAGLYPGA